MDTTPQAGWYEDPLGRHGHRWWSGSHWTEHVADQGQAGIDPLGSPPAQTAAAAVAAPVATAPTSPIAAPVGFAPPSSPVGVAATPSATPAPGAGQPSPTVTSAQPSTAGTTSPASPKRQRLLIGGAIVAVAALVIGGIVLFTGRSDDDSPAAGGTVAAGETVTIDSMSDGRVTTTDGVSVAVPAGAVPRSMSGEPGTIAFSVDVVEDLGAVDTSNLPPDVSIGATVYEFGPTGQSFDAPVTIEIPLASGVDPATVGGLAYFDRETLMWQQVTGTIDADAKVVRGDVMHFSPYSYWLHLTLDDQAQLADEQANGGYISVTNEMLAPYGWDAFPSTLFGYEQPHYRYTDTSYGVCIAGWDLDDPAYEARMSWLGSAEHPLTVTARTSRAGWAESGGTTKFWLPAGTYDLVEVWYPNEVNWGADPLYVPLVGSAYRPIGSLDVGPGSTHSFVEEDNVASAPSTSDGWIPERAACLGQPMPSLGSGSVQVSLNWPEDGIDLDLYVTDPSGDEIFYGNYPVESGGTLDSDNLSGGGIPENIFWPGTAPTGEYRVRVEYYGNDFYDERDHPANWTVSVLVDGNRTSYNGTITEPDDAVDVTTFTVE